MKLQKAYTVYSEQNIVNLKNEIVAQKFLRYFSSDSEAMARSIAASLQRIKQSWKIVDNRLGTTLDEWRREGFNES